MGSTDSSDLQAWLKRLPADAHAAFGALREQAQGLASATLAAEERFARLEQLRSRSLQLMPELRGRYMGKPVPLDGAEQQAWESCVGLWETLYVSYALCTDSDGDSQRAAAVWQRSLDCLGRAIREHALAYRAVPPALWKELNSCYRTADSCLLSELTVEDAEQPGTQPSCRRTYLISVLHEAASLYSLSPEQIQALEQLLPAWVAIAALASDNPKDASRSPLAIDLAGDQGARLARTLQPAETLRYVDTSQLAPKLRELGAAIRAGAVPLEFAATRTLTRPATERLLTHLYIQWCSAGTGRAEERFASQRRAQVACNLHAIHFQISGRAFRQPGDRYSREEEHDLATFGHITGMTTQRLLTTRSSVQEPWEILNESAGGMLSMNRKPDLRSRIRHGQLVAMRTSSMEPPDLAVVQRLRIDADGSLGIGVRVIRSDVRAVAVRPAGNPTLKYDRALIVDADKERDTPAYLILAAGSCAVGSVLEVHTGRAEKLVITSILEQGVDHDRAAYKPA